LKANLNSYYLADLLAQTQLEMGRRDEAKATYHRALEIIARLGEDNLWSHATAANAHLAPGDLDSVRLAAQPILGGLHHHYCRI
jgi:hypothetical protein